jgi:hypothetical protein
VAKARILADYPKAVNVKQPENGLWCILPSPGSDFTEALNVGAEHQHDAWRWAYKHNYC